MADAPPLLVVFDFDHTLYGGDSGADLIRWLLTRNPLRAAAAGLASPVLLPLLAWLPTRRSAISVYLWIATIGWRRREYAQEVERYVRACEPTLRQRLYPDGLACLHAHRDAGDEVVIATGAPPELIAPLLSFVAHEDLPVVGTIVGRRLGAVIAVRHCHAAGKVAMLRDAGYTRPIARAYTDSRNDLPLLKAAEQPVAVNPSPRALAIFQHHFGDRLQIRHFSRSPSAVEPNRLA